MQTSRLTWLKPGRLVAAPTTLGGSDHPCRRLMRIAMKRNDGDEAVRELARRYDVIAHDWPAWVESVPGYFDPLADAIAWLRAAAPYAAVLEVCCGSGESVKLLQELAPRIVAIDRSEQMIRLAGSRGLNAVVAMS